MRPQRGPLSPETANLEVAARLEEVAHLLHEQDANPFRVEAYRRAAQTVRALPEPVSQLFQREGLEGLDRLPTVGPAIARAVRDMVLTGVYPMLERLRGESDPARVLETVPGIGRVLARRLHEELGIDTLEQLEVAAHEGALGELAGFGEKKVRGIREALATRLGRRRAPTPPRAREPSVAELLDVDREYREKAAAGTLRRLTPRRFNPGRKAWLPVLHTRRAGRQYTALFSNTAQAHELGKTDDWVVLYYDGADGEAQCTVVTAAHGALAGERVVRGREAECAPLGDRRAREPELLAPGRAGDGEAAELLAPRASVTTRTAEGAWPHPLITHPLIAPTMSPSCARCSASGASRSGAGSCTSRRRSAASCTCTSARKRWRWASCRRSGRRTRSWPRTASTGTRSRAG